MNKGGEIYTIAEWNNLKDLELTGESFEHWFVSEVLAGTPDATNVNVYFVQINKEPLASPEGSVGAFNRYILLAEPMIDEEEQANMCIDTMNIP